ncbi:MAG: PDZ domain-containing protein, partial [Planctomycetota bacterium]
GLWVEGIEPGTLAAEAGVKRGDLLVEIDGKPIFEGQDVSDALAERGEFDELRLLVIGRRGDRRELIWQPPSEIR